MDPRAGGHHGWYLRWLAQGAIDRSLSIKVLTSSIAASTPDFAQVRSEFPRIVFDTSLSNRLAEPLPGVQGRLEEFARVLGVVKSMRSLAATTSNAHFLFPYFDQFAYSLGIAPSVFKALDWSGIVMSPSFHHSDYLPNSPVSAKTVIQARLFSQLGKAAGLRTLYCLDPFLPSWAQEHWPSDGPRMVYLPDPVEHCQITDRLAARQRLEIPSEKRVLLCYGSLSKRKGLGPLIQALEDLPAKSRICVVIAGHPLPDALALLDSEIAKSASTRGLLKVHPHRLSIAEESLYFSAADASWLGYQEFHQMSGVLVRSLAFGLPIIHCPEGLIGWYARQYRCGYQLEEVTKPHVVASLHWLMTKSTVDAGERARLVEISRNFSMSKAQDIVLASLVTSQATSSSEA